MGASVLASDRRQQIREAHVAVWVVSLAARPFADRDAWSVLSAEERARAGRLRRDGDRELQVLTRAFLRRVLADHRQVSPEDVVLGVGAEGKPKILGRHRPGWPYFNVSHSGSLSVIAVSEQLEVGVDVERVRVDPGLRDVASAFFSTAEVAAIQRLPPSARREAFFDCWVRKEAYLKGLGTGLRRATTDFDVPLGCEDGLVRDARRAGATHRAWHVYPIPVGLDYAAAVAVEGPARLMIHHPS
jgi:4'-phosphopantetheinyl transferase